MSREKKTIKNPSRFVQQNRALVKEERSRNYLWPQTQSDTFFSPKLEARAVLLVGSKTSIVGFGAGHNFSHSDVKIQQSLMDHFVFFWQEMSWDFALVKHIPLKV